MQSIANFSIDQRPAQQVILVGENGVTLTGVPTQAAFSVAAIGSNAIIPGGAGQRIFVHRIHGAVAGSQLLQWAEATATVLTGSMSYGVNSPVTMNGVIGDPVFATRTASNGVAVNLAASITFAGVISWVPSA